MLRKIIVSTLVLGAVIAMIPLVSSFVLTGGSWPGTAAGFRVNTNFPGALPGTAAQQLEAIRCGADAWADQGSTNFNFAYQGPTGTTSVNLNDGQNAVFYSTQTASGGTLATAFFNGGPTLQTFDIVFWSSNAFGTISWNGVGDSFGSQVDIIGVAVHEFGHALGLGHTPVSGATMTASINGTGITDRTLHPDDIAGVQFLYGTSSDPNDPVINNVDPPNGPLAGGNQVTITGANFTWESNTTLRIDGSVVSPVFWELENCGTLRIDSMPSNPGGLVSIEITNELGSVLLNDAYQYGDITPVITSIVPNAGSSSGGTPVQIIGQNFSAGASVFFGLNPLMNQQVVDSTLITGTTPPGAVGSVDVFVSQVSGDDTLPGGFTYTNNVLRIESGTSSPGASGATLQALADHNLDLFGFSFGVDVDSTFLTPTDINVVGTSAATAEFVDTAVDPGPEPGGFFTIGVITSLMLTDSIPAADNDPLANLVFDVDPGTPTAFPQILDVLNTLGSPAVDVCFVPLNGNCFVPDIVPGVLQITEGSLFIRGDGNGDNLINIADAVFVLAYLFQMGPADCLDALDVNDDGAVNIADGIYLLDNLFTMGQDPPPPFPNPGIDPTADTLDCNF